MMPSHDVSPRTALTANLLGLGLGASAIIGMIPAVLSLMRAFI
jgi:hypothetical protein